MKNLVYIPIAFLLVFTLSSFAINTNSSISNIQTSIENDTSIIQSYIFRIHKLISDGAVDDVFYGFELGSIIETKGYLKPKSGFINHQHDEETFLVVFFNQDEEEIFSTTIANPLIKHFEVADEDGTLKRERVEVDEEVITIRTNKLEDDMYYCQVYSFKNDTKGALIGESITTMLDPCEKENTGYIVAINYTQGAEAEVMKIYIDGKYIGEIPPGGESERIMLPAGQIYEVKGKTPSGAVQIKDIDLAKCEEVGVLLLYKE